METVAIDDVEVVPNPLGVHSVRKPVSSALNTEHFAMNYFELEPGEFQTGYNAGEDTLVGWAIGAPGGRHDWDELESVVYCGECGGETVHDVDLTEDASFRVACRECGAVQRR